MQKLLLGIILLLFYPTAILAFEPWNISIVGDTQTHNEAFYDTLSDSIAPFSPRIMLHLGDYTFAKRGDSLINKVVFRLRGDTQEKYSSPMEFHGVNGNHGAGYNKAMNDLSRNLICYGKLEEEVNPLIINGKSYYGVPEKNESLNPDVQKIFSYCVPEGNVNLNNIQYTFPSQSKFHQQYSFERSGIRFIITGYDFKDNQERKDWVTQEICKKTISSTTIILTHDPPAYHYADGYNSNTIKFWYNYVDSLPCTNNLKLVLGGHVHRYDKLEHNGVTFITISGMFFGELAPGTIVGGEPISVSDHLIAKVFNDKIEFYRYIWDGTAFNQGEKIFTIPGNFTQYSISTDNNNNAVTYDYNLQIGYNFISLPSGDIKSASDLANKVGDSFKAIASYDNKQWKIYIKRDNNFVGDNFDIDENKGYILLTNKSAQITVEGSLNYASTPTQLTNGWHLLSSHTLSKLANKEDPYAQDITQANTIAFMDNNRYVIATKDNDTLIGENFQIENAKSYFIFVKR